MEHTIVATSPAARPRRGGEQFSAMATGIRPKRIDQFSTKCVANASFECLPGAQAKASGLGAIPGDLQNRTKYL